MTIFYNDTSLEIAVNDNSYRYRAIKGEHSLTLYFSLPQHIELPVGAYCLFEAETYTLETPENLKMQNSRNFEYTVVFESSQAKARKYKFRNSVDRRLKFNLTATPREHLQLFVDNMNKRDGGWSIGRCIDAPEKLISYNHAFCIDALIQQADEFETEYEFNGKEVSLWKVEYNKSNPLPLSYGRGKGFRPGVGRTTFTDSKPVEVLFVQGGDSNIDASKYKSSELLLPKMQTLRYDGECFEDQAGFTESIAHTYVSDVDGFSIQRQDKPLRSHEEDSLDLSHIYPSRVGEVTTVEVVNKEKNFYDIIDNTIPQDLDFSKCLIEGETMSVIFQSGMLAGKEFEVKYCHEAKTANGVTKASRRFEIVPQEIDGQTMPNEIFAPRVGNKYAVFCISLPDAYVCNNAAKTGASWELFREAAKYLYENEQQKFTFTGELDGIWAKKDWLNIGGRIKLGGYVLFSDAQFQPEGVGIRIVGIKDYINNPHSPEIELSNSVVGGSIMSDIRKIESNEVLTDSLYKDSLQFTKRRFQDARQTAAMLEKAMLDFSTSVNPISVQTMQVLLGDESLQFRFVNSKTTPTTVRHEVEYDGRAKTLTVPRGILQHLTLGIGSLSSSHTPAEYRFWEVEAFASAPLTESAQSYYLYAKVSKSGTTGLFCLSAEALEMDAASDYYLLYGILNSESEDDRSFVSLYGFSELTPGRLTIPKIVSPDGQTYFDIEGGQIGGRISFAAGSSGLGNISEWPDVEQQIDQTQKAIEIINNDAIFDTSEKQSIRTQWENISGISNTTGNPATATGGSYIRALDTATSLSLTTTALIRAFEVLKTHLNDLELYAQGDKSGFERSAMASKFTAYYDAQIELSTLIAKQQSATQGDLDKDAMAKSLGYADYADMTKNQAIIDGGYIKGEVINTKYLVAENVKTALYGDRVEITGSKKRMQVFDAEDVERVTISGEKLDAFNPKPEKTDYVNITNIYDSKGPGFQKVNRLNTLLYSSERIATLCEFVYTGRETIIIPKFKWTKSTTNMSIGAELETLSTAFIGIYMLDKSTNEYELKQTLLDKSLGTNGNDAYYSAAISKFIGDYGVYKIEARMFSRCLGSWEFPDPPPLPSDPVVVSPQARYEYRASITATDKLALVISKESHSSIHANGILSYWGVDKYFGALQLENEDFIRAVNGRYGFKLNEKAGLLVSSNANSDSSNWNMPMNCVLMGKVNGIGQMLSCRSCNPNLRATVRNTAAGKYRIEFKDKATLASTYFDSPNDYIVVVYPKSEIISGYGLFEAEAKTRNSCLCTTLRWDHVPMNLEFVFFVIDIRNWVL